jgi:hypothetical protein
MPAFGAVLGLSSRAPFFAVRTEKTDKSQAVGGRGIPPLCTKRKERATRAAAPSP